MADNSPYEPPATRQDGAANASKQGAHKVRKLGTVILVLGVAVLVYGALAFFLVRSLPPNGGSAGRLPSLYVLFVGMGIMLFGAVVRGLRIR